MLNQETLDKIRELVEDFFQKMNLEVEISVAPPEDLPLREDGIKNYLLSININTQDPQILIGERGQTLNEIQQLLRAILKRKIQEPVFINFDIADYKKKKTEYLKEMVRSLADEVSLTKEEKSLPPMSSYERRIVHLELAGREDVVTESIGEEPERKIVVKPAA